MAHLQSPTGKILSIRENGGVRRALVEVDVRAVCPRCQQGKGCGAGLFGASRPDRRIEAMIGRESRHVAGDLVQLEMGSERLLQAAVIVYGWPLTGAAGAALLAALAGWGDAGTALAALTGLLLGAVLVRQRLAQPDCLSRFVPKVIDSGQPAN